jgi:dCMP deaminase
MSIALLAACRSPCNRLHVGSVIVKDHRIIAVGYNGFIAGCPHNSIVYDGHEQATVHSEINALSDCAKRGVSVDGATVYITHYPCLHCFKTLCACGITKIVYLSDYNNNPLIDELNANIGIAITQLIE